MKSSSTSIPNEEVKPIGHDGTESIQPEGDLVLANVYSSVASLGGNAREFINIPLSYTMHKPDLLKTLALCNRIYEDIKQDQLQNYSFITLRPSPEFMYTKWGDKIVGYTDQLNFIIMHLQEIIENYDTNLISCSIEKGTNKSQTQILHYHMIWYGSKKGLSRMKKHLINNHTNLHKVYGYQKALKESDSNAEDIFRGILYFNGIKTSEYKNASKETKYKQKPDVYKHFIWDKYLKKNL